MVHPFKVQRCLTIKRARIAQLSVAGASIIYNLIRFWEYELTGPNGEFQRRLRGSQLYFTVYYTTLYLLSHFLGPFLLIAVLNIFILLAIRRAQDQRTKLTYRQTQQRKTTQMIVVVTAVFAVCNTLPFMLNIWEAMRPSLFDPDDAWQPSAFLMLDISNVLVVVNSSTTILIYLIYCRKYRILWIYYVLKYVFRLSPSTIERYRSTSLERQHKLSSNSIANANGPGTPAKKGEGPKRACTCGTAHGRPARGRSFRRTSSCGSAGTSRQYSDTISRNRSYTASTTVYTCTAVSDMRTCDV